jgi:hypothetical protein
LELEQNEMTIKCLFGQRKCRYEGEYGPELLVAWDEFTLDGAEEGFEAECAKIQTEGKDEFSAFRIIDIVVPYDVIVGYLNQTPVIKGEASAAPAA